MSTQRGKSDVCATCHGSGACGTCGGTGEIWVKASPGHPQHVEDCPTCHGTSNCQSCGGSGEAK